MSSRSWFVLGLILTLPVVVLGPPACTPEDPTVSKAAFPAAMAEAVCRWVTACCDQAEQQSQPGSGSEAACQSQVSSQYANLFQGADAELWNGTEAQSLVDQINRAAEECPKAFDPAYEVAKRTLVEPTKQPGDKCTDTWDCSTKFCLNGVCANPLAKDEACDQGEPCVAGLRCLSGVCSELQPDGAQCTTGAECISGACGGGQCVVSPTYTCDGK